MSHRDKTLKFMALTRAPKEQTIAAFVADLRAKFQGGFGDDLPGEVAEAAKLVEETLNARYPLLEEAIAPLIEADWSEEELDALIAYQESAVARKSAEVTPMFLSKGAEITNEWIQTSLGTIDEPLQKLLGVRTSPPLPEEAKAPPESPEADPPAPEAA